MRESVKSLRVYMILVGIFSLISGLLGLGGDSARGGSLPVAVFGVLVGLTWIAMAIKLERMLVEYRGLVIALFGLGALSGVGLLLTGLRSHSDSALYRGIGIVAIALYLCFNAARLSRELRAAPTAGPASAAQRS